jgi:hypothetical protein
MILVISYHETWQVSYIMHEIRKASKLSATVIWNDGGNKRHHLIAEL